MSTGPPGIVVLHKSLRALVAALNEFEAQATRAVRLTVASATGAADVPRLHRGDQLR